MAEHHLPCPPQQSMTGTELRAVPFSEHYAAGNVVGIVACLPCQKTASGKRNQHDSEG